MTTSISRGIAVLANKGLYHSFTRKREFTLHVEKRWRPWSSRQTQPYAERVCSSLGEVIKALLNWFLFPGKLFTWQKARAKSFVVTKSAYERFLSRRGADFAARPSTTGRKLFPRFRPLTCNSPPTTKWQRDILSGSRTWGIWSSCAAFFFFLRWNVILFNLFLSIVAKFSPLLQTRADTRIERKKLYVYIVIEYTWLYVTSLYFLWEF